MKVRAWSRFLSGARFVEKVVLGLWLGLIGAGIAVFAAAVPNLYADEPMMRCGALAVTQITLEAIILGGMGAIVLIATIFRLARFFLEIRMPRRLCIVRFSAALLWLAAGVAGVVVFFNLIYGLEWTINHPPSPPPDIKEHFNAEVCRNLITDSHPHNWFSDHLGMPPADKIK